MASTEANKTPSPADLRPHDSMFCEAIRCRFLIKDGSVRTCGIISEALEHDQIISEVSALKLIPRPQRIVTIITFMAQVKDQECPPPSCPRLLFDLYTNTRSLANLRRRKKLIFSSR